MTWATFKKVMKDCATEVDGESYCTFRVSGCVLTILGVPSFIFMSVYSVVTEPAHHFDMLAFGSAFGGILSGLALLAGGVAFKAAKGESALDKGGSSVSNVEQGTPAHEHEVKSTDVEVEYYPDHPPRTESATFRRTKAEGHKADLHCAISGQPHPEYHHIFCEEAFLAAADWKTVRGIGTGEIKRLPVLDPVTDQPTEETFPVEQSLIWAICKIAELRGFDWAAFDPERPETFVDSMPNMLPLTSKFHRSPSHGIHHRDFATWVFQAFPRVKGFIFSPDEIV